MKRDLLLVSNSVRKAVMTVISLSLLICGSLFSPAQAYAQGKGSMVTGKVTDARGPMIGVTVSVKGVATRAALTDLDGNYSIDVAGINSPVLEFSYVFYHNFFHIAIINFSVSTSFRQSHSYVKRRRHTEW